MDTYRRPSRDENVQPRIRETLQIVQKWTEMHDTVYDATSN